MRHQLQTDVVIAAPAARIWAILTDFERYPAWNPFVTRIAGSLALDSELQVELRGPGSSPMKIKPRLSKLAPERGFAWRGRLLIPGLFDGEHHFELEPLGEQSTRFRHFELFSGVLVPVLKKVLDTKVRASFSAMNEALKQRAEATATFN